MPCVSGLKCGVCSAGLLEVSQSRRVSCILVSAVHPLAVLSAAFCIVCSLVVSVGLIMGP